MKTQKIIAAVMILASSFLAGQVLQDITYPAILCILGLLGLKRKYTWDIKPDQRVITSLLLLFLLMVFALQYRYMLFDTLDKFQPTAAAAWQTITRYFLAAMIMVLYLGSPRRLPISLGLFNVAITICAGQVLLLQNREMFYRPLELTSVLLLAIYGSTYYKSSYYQNSDCKDTDDKTDKGVSNVSHEKKNLSRYLLPAMLLLISLNSAWILSAFLYRHQGTINYLSRWIWGENHVLLTKSNQSGGVGFSDSGRLSSLLLVKQEDDSRPVLSITSRQLPGYLRARAFEIYRNSRWRDISPPQALFPLRYKLLGVPLGGRNNIFQLNHNNLNPARWDTMTIRLRMNFNGIIFTPLGSTFLEAPVGTLLKNENDVVFLARSPEKLTYSLACPAKAYTKAPTFFQLRRMLDVPPALDGRIRRLAGKIFAGCHSTTEKIAAVIKYFRDNYTYSLSLQIPQGQDHLFYFLLNKPAAYCEYFASGAAILLRLADVPTRYVTGFHVTEKDPFSNTWLARNIDAHAWVEAWDEQSSKWRIVEATVPQSAATGQTDEFAQQKNDGFAARYRELLSAFNQYGLIGLFVWLFQRYTGFFAGFIILLTAVGVIVLWRRINPAGSSRKSTGAPDHRLQTLKKMRRKMDRRLGRMGLARRPDETLQAYSLRLEKEHATRRQLLAAADWFRHYGQLRYRATAADSELQELRRKMQQKTHRV